MTDTTVKDIARALLGSWPNQVANWGRDGIAAYVEEVLARGISPDQALHAIRGCPADQAFPPSAPELAGLARQTEAGPAPTFDEALTLIYGKGGILRARPEQRTFDTVAEQARAVNGARVARARQLHPLVGSFAVRYGLERLHLLPINDPDYGGVRRRELERAWTQHVEAMQGRELAAIAIGEPRRGLTKFDPLAALGQRPAVGELETGDAV